MKKIILALLLSAPLISYGANLSNSELQGSFTGEKQINQVSNAYFSLNGDKLYTNMIDYEHLKCVALNVDDKNYNSKMICQEDGGASMGDTYILQSKNIFKNKIYVNVQYMGAHSSTLIDNVKETGFMGSREAEVSFVLIKN